MRYLVMGAGALGSVFGGLLQQHGHTVAFIGRGAHFEQITTRGLALDGIWGEFQVGPVAPLSASAAEFDVILLCVKSFDTQEACRRVRGLLAPRGLIVSVQNGLGNLEIIAREFGPARTIGARVIFGAQIIRPGLARVTVYAEPVLVGAMAPDFSHPSLDRLAADLNAAGIPTLKVDNILTHLWGKVLYNCALNPLGAILGAPYGSLGDNLHTRELMRLIIEEIYRVAGARGVLLAPAEAAAYFKFFMEKLVPATAGHRPSMWQDLQAGRRTEIDALNGAICRYGQEVGMPTPYNDAISRLVRFLEPGQLGESPGIS
ncbi:MAG: 2-dehydropantoate 2-reductase [Syntrophobacterales bacterium]|jgi:2-dehydropantoate 2-reductase|nr:2-dehydropantoate 2-reductase [Syntrophobacterales bacterium]